MKWKHLVIFRQPGIYAGWPANYGIWRSADNSIRTGFFAAKFLERETKQRFHPFDYNDREGRHIQIVSKDDGINWAVEQGPVLMPSVAFCQSGGKIWPDRVIGSQSSDSSPELNAQKLDLSHRDVRMLFSRTSFGHQPRSGGCLLRTGAGLGHRQSGYRLTRSTSREGSLQGQTTAS